MSREKLVPVRVPGQDHGGRLHEDVGIRPNPRGSHGPGAVRGRSRLPRGGCHAIPLPAGIRGRDVVGAVRLGLAARGHHRGFRRLHSDRGSAPRLRVDRRGSARQAQRVVGQKGRGLAHPEGVHERGDRKGPPGRHPRGPTDEGPGLRRR